MSVVNAEMNKLVGGQKEILLSKKKTYTIKITLQQATLKTSIVESPSLTD